MARNGSNFNDEDGSGNMLLIIGAAIAGVAGSLIGYFVKKKYDSNTATMEKSLGKIQWNLPDDKLNQIFSSKKK